MDLYHMTEADDPANKMTTAWKFHDAPNTACFTTTDVLNGAPILHVFHDYEGDWQFYGASDATASSSARIVSLAALIGMNDLLADLHDLPEGARADGQCERMWVQVTGIDEEEGCYTGTIENNPQHLAARYGDLVAFHPLHVADLAREQA